MESMLTFKCPAGNLLVSSASISGLTGPGLKYPANVKCQLLLTSGEHQSYLMTDDFVSAAQRISALGKVVRVDDLNGHPTIFMADKVCSVEEMVHKGHYLVAVHGGMRAGRVFYGGIDKFMDQFEPGEFIRMNRVDSAFIQAFFVRPSMVVAIAEPSRFDLHNSPLVGSRVFFRGRENGIPMEDKYDDLMLRMENAESCGQMQRFKKSDSSAVAIDPSAIDCIFLGEESTCGTVMLQGGTHYLGGIEMETRENAPPKPDGSAFVPAGAGSTSTAENFYAEKLLSAQSTANKEPK